MNFKVLTYVKFDYLNIISCDKDQVRSDGNLF